MKKEKSLVWAIVALKLVWSGIAVVNGRGKIGGTVISKASSGATARNLRPPSQPRTPVQQYVRSLFAFFSQKFRTLTASQISAWQVFANEVTLTNIFGEVYKLRGNTAYIRLNMNLTLASQAPIANPPLVTDTPDQVLSFIASADVSATELFAECEFSSTNLAVVPTGMTLQVWATPKMSPGIGYFTGRARLLKTLAAGVDTAAENLWTDYTSKYGAPAVGNNIVLLVQVVKNSSGLTSRPASDVVEIQA